VRPVAAASVLARLPKGMMPLATVLVLHQSTGSYGVAGIAVAATAPAAVPAVVVLSALVASLQDE
jgi:hypothetical protein